MKTINQKELEKYNVSDLNKMLDSISEMIIIPIHNQYNLSTKDLKQMKKDIEERLDELLPSRKHINQINN